MKSISLIILFFLLAYPHLIPGKPVREAQDRPNIVYILADDLGYGDLGCYGQEVLETPHIDRLAASGMRFTQHYSGCTVCAPSRSALLEGKHTGHSSVRGNIPYHLMDETTTSMAEALKPAGYKTAVIGKWGVGHLPPLDDPQRHGFDYSYGYINMWHAHNFYPEYLYRNGEKHYLPGNVLDERITFDRQPDGTGIAKEKVTFAPYEIEREALEYIDRNKDDAFFLYLSLNQPHNNGEYGKIYGDGGYEVPSYGPFTNRDWPRAEKGFAANIRIIDDIVGNVLAKLKDAGLVENTVILFSSDNGSCDGAGHSYQFFKSSGELRGYKRDLYEGGIRVPLIVTWPGKIQPGSSSNHISAMWDMLPTFCDLGGTDIPEGIDGISIVPELLNEGKQVEHEYLYWEFASRGGAQAVRQGKWKAVRLNTLELGDTSPIELYDLEVDISETNNLADTHPEIVKRMGDLMHEAHIPHPVIPLFP